MSCTNSLSPSLFRAGTLYLFRERGVRAVAAITSAQKYMRKRQKEREKERERVNARRLRIDPE